MLTTDLTKKALLKSNDTVKFSDSNCLLTISVGQPVHEQDKFKATLLAVNNHQFNHCTIMVCDSLQRHTMEIVSLTNKKEIRQQSIKLGDAWIKRNLRFIEKLAVPYWVARWDYWLNHPNYNLKRSFIDKLYLTDKIFQEMISDTIALFLKRNKDKIVRTAQEALSLSQEYLLEECAVMLIMANEGCEFEIYPSQRNLALNYIYNNIISLYNKNLMRPISVKFKNLSMGLAVA